MISFEFSENRNLPFHEKKVSRTLCQSSNSILFILIKILKKNTQKISFFLIEYVVASKISPLYLFITTFPAQKMKFSIEKLYKHDGQATSLFQVACLSQAGRPDGLFEHLKYSVFGVTNFYPRLGAYIFHEVLSFWLHTYIDEKLSRLILIYELVHILLS
jgi:hypothetical protein